MRRALFTMVVDFEQDPEGVAGRTPPFIPTSRRSENGETDNSRAGNHSQGQRHAQTVKWGVGGRQYYFWSD